METGIVGLETVRIDRIARWCSVAGPFLMNILSEPRRAIDRIPTRQLTGKKITASNPAYSKRKRVVPERLTFPKVFIFVRKLDEDSEARI